MSKLKRLLVAGVVVLSCAFLTGCETFESNCEEVLGGKYYSNTTSKAEYKYAYDYVQQKYRFMYVTTTTTVETCVKNGEMVDQTVTVT